jgi:hypothetical protein
MQTQLESIKGAGGAPRQAQVAFAVGSNAIGINSGRYTFRIYTVVLIR